jgi:hypothetical protein
VVREQAQAVAAAASQPVLMQVAQEAAAKDLLGQLGGLQEMLTGDPQLSELMSRFAERVQEDLGGPEQLERMLRGFGLLGPEGPFGSGKAPGPTSYDDRPRPGNDAAGPHQEPPGAPGDRPDPPPDDPGSRPAEGDRSAS